MNASVFSLLFLVFYNASFSDVERSVDRKICNSFNKEFKNLSINVINGRPEDRIKSAVSKVEQGVDLIKDQFDKEIRCQYSIKILSKDHSKTHTIYSKECFDIAPSVDYTLDYTVVPKTKIEVDGKSKILVRQRFADRFYFWEIGSCNPKSQNVFDSIYEVIDEQFLLKNHFFQVRFHKADSLKDNSNLKYKLFYANPGFLIKTAKCDINEKCKKNEVKVLSKKHLTNAILKKDNSIISSDEL